MKHTKKNLICGLFIVVFGQNVFGQTVQPVESQAHRDAQSQAQLERQLETGNKLAGHDDMGFIANRKMAPASTPLYKGRGKEVKNLKDAFERTKNMVIVPKNYYEQYKSLLKEKKMYLARLQPDKNCYDKYVVSSEELERCADVVPIPGGGSLYSFSHKLNYPLSEDYMFIENGIFFVYKKPYIGFDKKEDWWNLHFVDNKFIVQNSSVRGIISEIGDVGLEDISLASRELEFLNNFKQKDSSEEIKDQNEALKKGISFNNFTYFNSAAVKLNSTYVLRSIDYRSVKETRSRNIDKETKKHADSIVAFKVVGREDDGSVIILWKEIKATPLLPN